MIEEYQKKIIDLFIEQELLIADLYDSFSVSFPEHRDFWTKIANDERDHAGWVQKLLNGVIEDKIYFSEGKTRTYTVKTSIEFIKKTISNIDFRYIDMVKALAISRNLETSLLERNMFKHFEGDSVQVKKVLSYLEKEQDKHCSDINDKLLVLKQIYDKLGIL